LFNGPVGMLVVGSEAGWKVCAPLVSMLLEIAVTTITLVAAWVVSIVLRPDPEMLRPIDEQASGSSSNLQRDVDRSLSGDGTAQFVGSMSTPEDKAA
jgi:hypothetical protein